MTDVKKSVGDSKPTKGAFERHREDWQKQMIADPDIPTGALKVAIAISFHFNRADFIAGRGAVSFPGIAALAKLTGLHRTSVMRAVRWLEARGHIKVMRRRIGKKNLANRYYPLLKTVAQLNKVPSRKDALPPSSVAMRPPSSVAMRPEPLTEPPTQCKSTASIGMDAPRASLLREEKKGDDREKQASPWTLPDNATSSHHDRRTLMGRRRAHHQGPARPHYQHTMPILLTQSSHS